MSNDVGIEVVNGTAEGGGERETRQWNEIEEAEKSALMETYMKNLVDGGADMYSDPDRPQQEEWTMTQTGETPMWSGHEFAPTPIAAVNGRDKIRLLQLNWDGKRGPDQTADFWAMVEQFGAEIICIQDHRMTDKALKREVVDFAYRRTDNATKFIKPKGASCEAPLNSNGERIGGTAVMVLGDLAQHVGKPITDGSGMGRFAGVELVPRRGATGDFRCIVMTGYLPVFSKQKGSAWTKQARYLKDHRRADAALQGLDPLTWFWKSVAEAIQPWRDADTAVILTGDLNTLGGEHIERARSSGDAYWADKKRQKRLLQFLTDNGMINLFELFHRGTYPVTFERNVRSRSWLDHVLVSHNAAANGAFHRIGVCMGRRVRGSEHRAILVELNADAVKLNSATGPQPQLDGHEGFQLHRQASNWMKRANTERKEQYKGEVGRQWELRRIHERTTEMMEFYRQGQDATGANKLSIRAAAELQLVRGADEVRTTLQTIMDDILTDMHDAFRNAANVCEHKQDTPAVLTPRRSTRKRKGDWSVEFKWAAAKIRVYEMLADKVEKGVRPGLIRRRAERLAERNKIVVQLPPRDEDIGRWVKEKANEVPAARKRLQGRSRKKMRATMKGYGDRIQKLLHERQLGGFFSAVLGRNKRSGAPDTIVVKTPEGPEVIHDAVGVAEHIVKFYESWMGAGKSQWFKQETENGSMATQVLFQESLAGWEARRRLAEGKLTAADVEGVPQELLYILPCFQYVRVDNTLEPGKEMYAALTERITTKECLTYCAGKKKGTAGGLTGPTIDQLNAAPESLYDDIAALLNVTYETGIIPAKLTEEVICSIEKVAGVRDLDKQRPITLQETLRKMLLGIKTRKMAAVWLRWKLISTDQYAFLAGLDCSSPLLIKKLLNDNATMTRRPLIQVLQDIHHAYDESNNAMGKEAALRRLHVPEHHIYLLAQMDKGRRVQVDTGAGLSGGIRGAAGTFHPVGGWPQGGEESPAGWVAEYDVFILAAMLVTSTTADTNNEIPIYNRPPIYNTENGFTMGVPDGQGGSQDAMTRVQGAIYADDHIQFSDSLGNAEVAVQKCFDLGMLVTHTIAIPKYYLLCMIPDLAVASQHGTYPQSTTSMTILNKITGETHELRPTPVETAVRYLGHHAATIETSDEKQIEIVRETIRHTLQQLRTKRIRGYGANITIRMVLQASIMYPLRFATLSNAQMDALETPVRAYIKNANGLNEKIPTDAVNGMMLRLAWADFVKVERICIFLQHANNDTTAGSVLRTELQRLQEWSGSKASVLQTTARSNDTDTSWISRLWFDLNDLGVLIVGNAQAIEGQAPDETDTALADMDWGGERINARITEVARLTGIHWTSQVKSGEALQRCQTRLSDDDASRATGSDTGHGKLTKLERELIEEFMAWSTQAKSTRVVRHNRGKGGMRGDSPGNALHMNMDYPILHDRREDGPAGWRIPETMSPELTVDIIGDLTESGLTYEDLAELEIDEAMDVNSAIDLMEKAAAAGTLPETIHSYSDASVKHGVGSYAWLIDLSWSDPNGRTIVTGGIGRLPDATNMDSTRAELGGTLAPIIVGSWIAPLTTKFRLHHQLDNSGDVAVFQRVDNFTVTDWTTTPSPDLWNAVTVAKAGWNDRLDVSWLRGHPEKRKTRDTWTRAETFNHRCDALADFGARKEPWRVQVTGLALGRRFWLATSDGLVTGRVKEYLQQRTISNYLVRYIQTKYGERVARGVTFAPMMRMLKKNSGIAYLSKAIQFSTSWLSTFDVLARRNTYKLPDGHTDAMCPMCGVVKETNSHIIFECRDAKSIATRTEWINGIRAVIAKANLPPDFCTALLTIWHLTDNGTLKRWNIAPADLQPPVFEQEDEFDSLGFHWTLTADETLQMLQQGTTSELVYRGWLPRHWQDAMEGMGMSTEEAEQFLSAVQEKIFTGWYPIFQHRHDTLHPPPSTDTTGATTASKRSRRDNDRATDEHKEKHKKYNKSILQLLARDTGRKLERLPDDWNRGWKLQQKRMWIDKATKDIKHWYNRDTLQRPITSIFPAATT
jgi:hypothetical protein